MLPEGTISPPDPEYDGRQARLLEAVKSNPDVLKRWILEEIALQIEAHSVYELADMITGGEVALQDILAPALETLSAEDREYFDEVARLEVFEECIDMFMQSFTVKEDAPVVIQFPVGHKPWSEISAKLRADPERRARIEQQEKAIEAMMKESEQDEVEVSPELASELDSARAEIASGDVRDFQEYQQQKKCSTCHGYGLWAMGDPSPMGAMDAQDGYSTRPCPECGANANPVVGTAEKEAGKELPDFPWFSNEHGDDNR